MRSWCAARKATAPSARTVRSVTLPDNSHANRTTRWRRRAGTSRAAARSLLFVASGLPRSGTKTLEVRTAARGAWRLASTSSVPSPSVRSAYRPRIAARAVGEAEGLRSAGHEYEVVLLVWVIDAYRHCERSATKIRHGNPVVIVVFVFKVDIPYGASRLVVHLY